MPYLIQQSSNSAKERNQKAYLLQAGTGLQGAHNTTYLWHMITHPTSGKAALEIPNPFVGFTDEEGNEIDGNLSQEEFDSLVDTLTADWTLTEEI